MSTLFYAKAEIDGAITRTETELIIPAVLAREGILKYGSKKKYLPAEELRKAVRSFDDCLVTVSKHPFNFMQVDSGMVVPIKNFIMHQNEIHGKVRNATYDPEAINKITGKKSAAIRGEIHLFLDSVDASKIEQIEKGLLRDVSRGFTAIDEESPGEWNGEKYDTFQTDIVVNHIAIVPKGRMRSPEIGLFVDADDSIAQAVTDPWETTEDYVRSGHGSVEDAETCRTTDFDGKLPDGIKAIYCKSKRTGDWFIQSYLFPKDKFTEAEAKAWFKANADSEEVATENYRELSMRLSVLEVEMKALKKPLVPAEDRAGRPINKDTDELIRVLREIVWQPNPKIVYKYRTP